MPSTYAHYRMGQEVLEQVSDPARSIIMKHKQLYDIGLHGPDILFYYHPLRTNPVNAIGYGLHERSGKYFFGKAAEIIEKAHDKEAALAYIYGFICHFALDSTCHGYIDEKIAQSGVSHTEIEVEFDRSLMIEDGKDPVRQDWTKHIVPSMENAEVIAHFFPGAEPKQVKKALKGMIRNNQLLLAPSGLKRKMIYAILRLSGNYKEMHGLLVNFKANPACKDSTEKLHQMYAVAENRAVMLIDEYGKYMTKEDTLNALYNYTFSGKEKEAWQREDKNDKG